MNGKLPNDPRLYRQVANSLRSQITDETYRPGDVLPSIEAICATHGISRQTTGKALRVLSNEGLVQFVPGRGYYVCERS
jgi:DNA-binding GntR family transcriptional regulator